MKHLKMLGLVVVAALAVTALVGVASASATVICKNNTSTSKCTEPYPVGTKGTASLQGSMILETTGGTSLVTCTGSTVSSTLGNAGSATTTVKSELSSITFSGCTKAVTTLVPGSGELHHISGTDNGTLTTQNTQVTVSGLFNNESCIYGTGAGIDMGTTVGGNPGSLTINTLVLRQAGSGVFCPAETRLTAKYVATSPTNAWVAAG